MMKGAERLVKECAGLRGKEKVLIVTDTKSYIYGKVVMAAAQQVAEEVSMIIMPTYGRIHGQEPPSVVAKAMLEANVVFLPSEWSMSHTKARMAASRVGVRCLAIPSPDEEIFARVIAESPFSESKSIVMKVNNLLSEAKEARVTTRKGTSLELKLEGRKNVDLEHGYCLQTEEYSRNFAGPPCIEANIAPNEGTAEGVLVVDAAHSALGVLDKEIRFIIEKGEIVSVEGGREARLLKSILDAAREPELYKVAELGIGLNPIARLRGRFIEDEAVLGTAHIGMGNNASTMDGKITVSGHCDAIFWEPTIELDGKTIMSEGKLLLEDLPEAFKYLNK